METAAICKYIVLDTNCMFQVIKTPDYRSVEYNADLIGLRERITENGKKDAYVFLIPELCLREFIARKTAEILDKNKELVKLQECFSRYGMLLQEVELLSADAFFGAYQKMLCDDLSANGFQIIPICPAEYFQSIVDDAVAKRPPFEGKEKQSDKGFKDTVIWYSVLDYAKSHAGKYYFISNDGIFHTAKIFFQNTLWERANAKLELIRSMTQVPVKLAAGKEALATKQFLQYRIQNREQLFGGPDGRTVLKVNYQWPVILEEGEPCDRMKTDLEGLLERKMGYWASLSADHQNEEFYGFSCLTDEVDFRLKYNKDGVFSFILYSYLYLGGAHGTPTLEGYVYDLPSGKRLGIRDIWKGTEEAFFETLKNKVQEYYNSTREKYGDRICEELPYHSMDQAKFYVDERGLIVHFDSYEIGCYAEGLVEVVVQDQ